MSDETMSDDDRVARVAAAGKAIRRILDDAGAGAAREIVAAFVASDSMGPGTATAPEPLEDVLPPNAVVTFSGPHDIDTGDGNIEVGYLADVWWPSGDNFREGTATGSTIGEAIRQAVAAAKEQG